MVVTLLGSTVVIPDGVVVLVGSPGVVWFKESMVVALLSTVVVVTGRGVVVPFTEGSGVVEHGTGTC